MTYTSLATPVPNTPILVSSFGALVKQDLDDLDGRITATNTNLGTPWVGGSALSRIQLLETSHSVRYERTTSAQSIPSGSDTVLTWQTAVRTDTTVFTQSGGSFTCVKAGWVDVTTSLRMAAAANFELKIKKNGNRMAANAGGSSIQSNVATGFPVIVGDVITAVAFHTTGSAQNTETGAENQNHIALSWRGF